MALVRCVECREAVSTYAASCPRCGLPYPGRVAAEAAKAEGAENRANRRYRWAFFKIVAIWVLLLVGGVPIVYGLGGDAVFWAFVGGVPLAVFLYCLTRVSLQRVLQSTVGNFRRRVRGSPRARR